MSMLHYNHTVTCIFSNGQGLLELVNSSLGNLRHQSTVFKITNTYIRNIVTREKINLLNEAITLTAKQGYEMSFGYIYILERLSLRINFEDKLGYY